MPPIRRTAGALAAAFLVAAPAVAQQAAPTAETEDGIAGYAAAGVGFAPDYEGSDDYTLVPYADFRADYRDYYLRLEGTDLRANLVPSPNFHAGPLIAYRRGREDVEDDRVDRMADIDAGVGLGGFVEFERVDAADPRKGERLTLMVSQGATGDSDGLTALLRGVVRRPLEFANRGLIASFIVDTTWADDDYMETHFAIGAADAARSGLSAFSAGSGFKTVGVGLALDQFLSETWSIGTRLHYARLLGDAADSPVTDTAGSPDELFGALTVGLRF